MSVGEEGMKDWWSKNRKKGILLTGIALAAVLALVVFLRTEMAREQVFHLIFISKTMDPENGFWTSLIDGAELGAKEFGAEIQVAGETSEENIEGQIAKIRESIEKQPDAILVAPCDYAETSEVLQEVVDHGIRLILLDSVIDRDIAESTVSTDNYLAGQELGKYTRTLLKEEPVIGIVAHVKGTSTAMERENGIRDGLGTFEKEIREVVFCGSSYEKAYHLTVELLEKYPDMNVLIGTNEYSAVGAARAVRDLGLAGKVTMVGFDNSVEQIQLLEEGVFQAIIIQKPFNMGYLGVEQAIRSLTGKKVEKNVDSGCKLITKENLYEEENQRLLYPFSGQQ